MKICITLVLSIGYSAKIRIDFLQAVWYSKDFQFVTNIFNEKPSTYNYFIKLKMTIAAPSIGSVKQLWPVIRTIADF